MKLSSSPRSFQSKSTLRTSWTSPRIYLLLHSFSRKFFHPQRKHTRIVATPQVQTWWKQQNKTPRYTCQSKIKTKIRTHEDLVFARSVFTNFSFDTTVSHVDGINNKHISLKFTVSATSRSLLVPTTTAFLHSLFLFQLDPQHLFIALEYSFNIVYISSFQSAYIRLCILLSEKSQVTRHDKYETRTKRREARDRRGRTEVPWRRRVYGPHRAAPLSPSPAATRRSADQRASSLLLSRPHPTSPHPTAATAFVATQHGDSLLHPVLSISSAPQQQRERPTTWS